MKRQILSIATAMALTAGGAIFAQSTLNTPAPGPSQETKPGQTNNNLQNPGSNMQKPATPTNGQATTTTTTTTTTPTDTTATAPTDTTTGTMNNDTTGTMNNDQTGTGSTTGTMNNGTTGSTTGTYNSNTGTTTGSSMDNTSTTTTSTRSSRLPKTASDLPTVALMGLLALSAFFAVRVYAKRNA